MTQPELSRLLQEVGAVPAPAADYGAVVRSSVQRGQLVRTGLLGAAGLAAVAVLAAVGLTVIGGGDDRVEATRTTAPTVEPSEEPTPTEEPTQEPTLEPTEEPTQEPTVDPTTQAPVVPTDQPEPTQQPEPEPEPEPTSQPTTRRPTTRPTTAPPKPFVGPGASAAVRYRVLDDSTHLVEFTITIRDTDGYLLSGTLSFGDGSSVAIGKGSTTCGGGGRDAQPSSTTKTFTHTYTGGADGEYAQVRASTGSTCRSTPKESPSAFTYVTA